MQKHAIERSFERWLTRALHIPALFDSRARKLERKLVVKKTGRRLQKTVDHIIFWTVTYPAFFLVAVFFILPLRLTGRFRIRNPEHWPKKGRTLIATNHKEHIIEPIMLVSIGMWQSLIHPYKMMPWVVVDSKNYRKWYWCFMWQRFIFLPRNPQTMQEMREVAEALELLVRVIKNGGRGILFDSGGRDSSDLRKGEGERHVTPEGHIMRQQKGGTARVMCRAGGTIIAGWIEGTDHFRPRGAYVPRLFRKVTVAWGGTILVAPVRGSKKEVRERESEVTQAMTHMILATADREFPNGSG